MLYKNEATEDVISAAGMRAKFRIFNDQEADEKLSENLLTIIQKNSADYTNTFLALTSNKLEVTALFNSEEFKLWNELWKARLSRQQESKANSLQLMRDSNPAIIPRNHRVEEALEAAVERGNYSEMERLLEVLSNPFVHSQEQLDFFTVPATSNGTYQTFCGT